MTTVTIAAVLDAALKGAVLVVLAALVTATLSRRSAALRHAIWTAAIVAQLLLPALALLAPAWHLPLLPAPTWLPSTTPLRDAVVAATRDSAAATTPAATETATPAATPSTARTDSATATTAATPSRMPSTPVILVGIWSAGALLVLLRLVVGTVAVWRLARRGARVHDGRWLSLTQRIADRLGISRPLTLLKGASVGVPVTWGVVYPVVLLPTDADAWDVDRRRCVLVHEMAHVRRLDALTQLVAQLAVAVFWFSPFVWLAASRLRLEREHACDDYVLREGTLASRYADDLLAMVRALGTPEHRTTQPAFAALAMARPSEFEGRMLAILDPNHDRHPLQRRGLAMLTAAVLIVAMPLAGFSPLQTRATSSTSTTIVHDGSTTTITKSGLGDGAACDDAVLRRDGSKGSSTTHISDHDSDDPKSRSIRVYTKTSGRCTEAVIVGDVEFSDDERSVKRVGPGALALFRERLPDSDWMVRYASGAGEPTVMRDGRSAPFDAAAQAWLAEFLPEALREASVDAPKRVARLYREGGTDRVLTDIAKTRSSGSKRTHYVALFGLRDFPSDDLYRALQQATRDLAGSSGDLRAILEGVPQSVRHTAPVRKAVTEGVARIDSDGDRAAVLKDYMRTGDRELLIATLGSVHGIESDGDKRSVLVSAVQQALRGDDGDVRDAWFSAASTIESDGDLRAVLFSALPYASPAVTEAIILTTTHIESDGDASAVLVGVARRGLLTTGALRDQYLKAAREIESDGDYRRVVDEVLNRQ